VPALRCARQDGVWDRKKFKGVELSGKVLGIVGLGNIGKEVAKYCQRFGMRTIAFDPIVTPDAGERLNIEMVCVRGAWLCWNVPRAESLWHPCSCHPRGASLSRACSRISRRCR
jgi:hypothetical protein